MGVEKRRLGNVKFFMGNEKEKPNQSDTTGMPYSQGSPLRIESKSITPSAGLEYKHNKI